MRKTSLAMPNDIANQAIMHGVPGVPTFQVVVGFNLQFAKPGGR